jgi:uncharacterized protein (TIRG00374 family)
MTIASPAAAQLRTVRWPRLVIGVVVAAIFGWLAFRHVDWSTAMTAMRNLDPWWLAAALFALSADYVLRILRWWRMLVRLGTTVPMPTCAAPFLCSIALNNLLPFRAGDVARTVAFTGTLGLPIPAILATMVAERLLDLSMLLLLLAVGMSGLPADAVPQSVAAGAWTIAAACAATVLGIALTPAALVARLRAMAARPGIAGKFARMAADFCSALTFLRSPRVAVELVTLSLAVWLSEGAVFAGVGSALHLSLGRAAWFACSLGTLSTMLPSTPGYVGTFDYFTILATTTCGVAHDVGALFAVVVHLVLWLPLTVAGLIAIMFTTMRNGQSDRPVPGNREQGTPQ